ncbi:MAG: hypothetical protein HWN67_03020 [Candidatus Helarchaeota archaeon]|nr:hypothetical protein [Candidatus Helarchaeota archaeon]
MPIYFLYAEIHYKLFGVFSLLWRKLPEIIADVPFRVEPKTHIPVFCIIKDADIFPIKLNRVDIEVIYPDHHVEKLIFPFSGLRIAEKFWGKIFYIKPKNGFSGLLKINVYFSISYSNKDYYFKNDNYKKIEHRPFGVYVSKEIFPSFDNCIYGDIHYHSNFTSDVAEFGAPLEIAKQAAAAMGLDFFVSADHSYDFEYINNRSQHNFQSNNKWEQAKKTAEKINKQIPSYNGKKVIVFQGEEVSCGNSKNKNIHLILFNYEKFVHGSGDNALVWFKNKPDNDLKSILMEVSDSAVAFAAHPEVKNSLLEKLFLRRSKWTDNDYMHKNLDGFQILNGALDSSFFRGVKKWKEILLKGEKKFVVAGSDAHGNFNCYRQIGIPSISMNENKFHIFGNVRTGVYVNGNLSEKSIISGLKKGSYFITNGPAVRFFVKNEKNEKAESGESIRGKNFYLSLEVRSNSEFGKIKNAKIHLGDLNIRKEFNFKCFDDICEYSLKEEVKLFPSSDNFYIRISASAVRSGKRYMCLTNPIWMKRGE